MLALFHTGPHRRKIYTPGWQPAPKPSLPSVQLPGWSAGLPIRHCPRLSSHLHMVSPNTRTPSLGFSPTDLPLESSSYL